MELWRSPATLTAGTILRSVLTRLPVIKPESQTVRLAKVHSAPTLVEVSTQLSAIQPALTSEGTAISASARESLVQLAKTALSALVTPLTGSRAAKLATSTASM